MAIEITAARTPRIGSRRERTRELRAHVERNARRALVLRVSLLAFVVVCACAFAGFVYAYQSAAQTVDARLANGYLTSRAGLYAAPRVLRAGQNVSRDKLIDILRRAGYAEDEASNVWNGAFMAHADSVEILPRRDAAGTPDVVRVEFDRRGRIRELTGDGTPLAAFALEPEALTNDAAVKTARRAALAYNDLPPALVNAVLAIEDRRFYAHSGLDFVGLGRALLSWTGFNRANEVERQGGSTITQQLVKNTYLTPARTLRRKFDEAMLAAALERRLSKQDILALYCNEVYLGQRGATAVRGVAQAARVYFGKDLKDLTLAEAATIAGMIQSPARYAPDRHPEEARARRNVVLAGMLRDAAITREQAEAASREPVTVAPLAADTTAVAPYFIDYVSRQVDAQLQHAAHADEGSLRVYTTLDLDLQQIAEGAVRRQLEGLAKVYKGKATPQAALVALDPRTGHVLAMVGGDSYARTQLNRATDARRQPGSVFKPFVYAAAIESGISPAALVMDAPREFVYDQRATYRPANYGGAYTMRPVTMRTGLVRSLNVVTVDLALRAGLPRVASVAAQFGLPKPAPYPALALGTTEATPLEIASAYTAFANHGTRAEAAAVTRALTADGTPLLRELTPAARQVVRPSTAYMITDALADVIDEGTARSARGLEKLTAVAGKTGTSRDGWFAGYTPNLVCVVWVGFDDNAQLGLTGAASALPVWQEFIREAVALRPELGGDNFVRPDGITTVEIDTETGLLAGPDCPHRQRIAVTPALAPVNACFTHQPPLALVAYNDAAIPASDANAAAVAGADALTLAPPAPQRVPSLPRANLNADPPPLVAPTRIETSRNGRPRLVNDLRAAP
jgi:penicillin-binding protein 1B